ncbi:MAG: peptidoglycan DD-metalloendopeptidase family protein [bacterium]|nr:peptidoglycan DD-metalloendopeptidase family protein [bacterium]
MKTFVLFLTLFVLLSLTTQPVHAQGQCGTADAINYPVDTAVFRLVQDFSVASPRHQGRYHTGEDWSVGSSSYAQPVRAAATGLVTYSAPTGWGRDGGVIILEHTFPDGSRIYTQYGHIMQTDSVVFPARYTCVQAGDIIAVIADARPAPHLHFEVRVSQPDNPGSGYSRENPETLGFRRPAQFIANYQAALHPAFRWSTLVDTFGPIVPPLVLDDGSLLAIDGDLLRGIGANGGVAWRVPAGGAAVSLTGFELNPYITFADGSVTRVDYQGAAQESYTLNFTPDSPPIAAGDTLIYHTTDNTLTALSANRREIAWQVRDVPAFREAVVIGNLIGLETVNNSLMVVAANGQILDEADLRDGASLTVLPDGRLLAYTSGGLWAIDASGEWAEYIADAPDGGNAGVVLALSDGRVYLLDGMGQNLTAYDTGGQILWQARLPLDMRGESQMAFLDGAIFIISTHGQMVVAGAEGGFCGYTRVYGDDRAKVWFQLSQDNTLRVALGNQYLGLDWETFAGNCVQ